MANLKLLELLAKLDSREVRRFRDFASSTYFNKREDTACFAQAVCDLHPRFDEKQTEKQALYRKAFPDQAFDAKHLGYLMSWTQQLLEEFLAVESFRAKPLQNRLLVLERLRSWDLDKHYASVLRDIEKIQKKNPYRDADYQRSSFELESIKNSYFDAQKKHIHDDSLIRALEHLDSFYFIEKLRYSCEILNRRQWVKADYEIPFLDNILDFLDNSQAEDNPVASVYLAVIRTLQDASDDHFQILKEKISESQSLLPRKEKKDVHSYAINFCISRINGGDLNYLNELFELFKSLIELDLLLDESGALSPWTFKNIVSIACRVEEYNWADSFINQHLDAIPKDFRENARVYNHAYLAFSAGRLDEALSLLQQVEFSDIYYGLDARTILLKLYFMKEELDALDSLMHSFRIWINRNKQISSKLAKPYLNLIASIKELSRIGMQKEKLLQFQQKIRALDSIADLKWLEKQLELRLK
jgi:hypothetical protein